jgi:phosphatidylglycerophosphate synthase
MFDARLRPLIDPPLNRAGRVFAGWGIGANLVSMAGIAAGLSAAGAILVGQFGVAIALILLGRLLDGLDGAVARATAKTPFGGYLDIVGDFLFYVSVPLAFGLADPANLKPAMVLLATFALTGVSFLALAAVAAEADLETPAPGQKSFFYSTGVAEGGETILAFLLMCLWPDRFGLIAWIFAALCAMTVVRRTLLAWALLRRGA